MINLAKPYLVIGVAVALGVTHIVALMSGYTIASNSAKAKMQQQTQERLIQVQDLLAENVRLNNEVRELEEEHSKKLTAFSQTYQEQLNNVRLEKDQFISGVRSGAIRLRLPQTTPPSNNQTNTKTITASSGCDGEAGSYFPRETTEFLYGEASRADEIVKQLQACQQVVLEYFNFK